jgi:glycosyltransferase involved in cell wall biosynthesis
MDVTLLLAPSRERIDELMRSAAVYVSATGFGVKDERDDHLCEHFGITVVEAASAGCIPVVYARGGPADLVKGFGAGHQFDSIPTLADALAQAAIDSESATKRGLLRSQSEGFSEDVFITRWKALIDAAG